MDLGVGAFVFSQGIVSLRSKPMPLSALLRRTLPMLLLGGARVLLVKSSEYPEHVTEYGVHWNFFITMGLLLPATELVQRTAPHWHWGIVGLVVGVSHELSLRYGGLGPWALQHARDPGSWLSLNKEGIASWGGYLAMAFLGLDTGAVCFQSAQPRSFFGRLAWRAAAAWAALWATMALDLPVSRRMVRGSSDAGESAVHPVVLRF